MNNYASSVYWESSVGKDIIMIESKADLKKYLYADEVERFGEKVSLFRKIKLGDMWFYNVHLRKLEYWLNCRNGFLWFFDDYIASY